MSGRFHNLTLEMFPTQITDLHTEVRKHPVLMKLLAEQENKDVYIQLLEIASYCGIVVSGDYTQAQILALCEEMTKHLYVRRTGIVIVH